MIDKLNGLVYGLGIIRSVVNKVNELVDAVNKMEVRRMCPLCSDYAIDAMFATKSKRSRAEECAARTADLIDREMGSRARLSLTTIRETALDIIREYIKD